MLLGSVLRINMLNHEIERLKKQMENASGDKTGEGSVTAVVKASQIYHLIFKDY